MPQYRNLIIYECSVKPNADGIPQIVTEKQPKLQRSLKSIDIESCKKEARERLLQLRKNIRTISFTNDGNVKAVVWKGQPPQRTKTPGWRFKRSNSRK